MAKVTYGKCIMAKVIMVKVFMAKILWQMKLSPWFNWGTKSLIYTWILLEDWILIIPGFYRRTGSWLYLNFIGGLDPDYTLISLEDWILIIPGFHRRTRSWLYLDFIGGLDPDPPTWHWYNPSSSSRTSEIFNDQSPASCNIFIYFLTSTLQIIFSSICCRVGQHLKLSEK